MRRDYYKQDKYDNDETLTLIVVLAIYLSVKLKNFDYWNVYSIILMSLLGLMIIAYIIFSLFFARKLINASIAEIDKMDGLTFENYVRQYLTQQGYSFVKFTEYYDLGLDLIATKNKIRYGIQVKRHKGKVGVSAVRQAVTALRSYECDQAMVITNSVFTKNAKTLAADNNCILLDRRDLLT